MTRKSDNVQPVNLPFVGRQEELEKFHEMLDVPDAPWLMWVIGSAGQGKSKFLEACLEECEKRKLHHSDIIDFFNDGLRTRWGVITELAKRFHVEGDKEFENSFNQYQRELTKGDDADPDVLQFSLNQSEEALIKAIRPKRKGKPHVIFVDTVEEIIENLGVWFFEKLLPNLYPHFRVVAGGRRVPSVGNDETVWVGQQPYFCELKGLKLENIRQYLQEEGLLTYEMNAHLEKLHQLTKGGQALLVALACLALKENRLTFHDFENITELQFLKKLVIDPHREGTVENFVILELAHAYHGYTPATLELRYSLDKLNAESHDDFLGKLIRFPYIKHYMDTGATRLHDYFRERLSEDLWTVIDPDLEMRANISRQLAAFFEDQIQGYEKNNISESPALDTLRHQWLYHLLFADRERAYGEIWELLDISWHTYKWDYMNSLLQMIREVNGACKLVGKFDAVLDRLEKAARAWLYVDTWRLDEALDVTDAIIQDNAGVKRLYLTALVAKATALGRKGIYDEPISMLRKAFDGYEELLDVAKSAEQKDQNAIKILFSEHGIATVHGILPERYLILNTIGVFLRRKGQFEKAKDEFVKSYELSHAEGDLRWQASAATQIGTSLRYEGNIAEAYDRMRQGLVLRQKLRQKGQEAFSLQALGMLKRDDGQFLEAKQFLTEAYNIWKELRADGYLASVERNFGWLNFLDENYEKAESHYSDAEKIYQRLNQVREFPNLRQKQGVLWLEKARREKDDRTRAEFASKAEALLLESVSAGEKYQENLYLAHSLVGLCRLAELRGDFDKIREYEVRLRKFESDKYQFELIYADLEEVLGNVSIQKANFSGPEPNLILFDDATDHYCMMFVYLARFSSSSYRQRREFLRKWLPSLPDQLRHRASKRLIECWESRPEIASRHPGFIATIRAMDDL